MTVRRILKPRVRSRSRVGRKTPTVRKERQGKRYPYVNLVHLPAKKWKHTISPTFRSEIGARYASEAGRKRIHTHIKTRTDHPEYPL